MTPFIESSTGTWFSTDCASVRWWSHFWAKVLNMLRNATSALIVDRAPSGSDSIVTSGISEEDLTELRPGQHVVNAEWKLLFGEARLRTRIRAVDKRKKSVRGVYSHTAAAAEHHLPLYRVRDDHVELTVSGRNGRRHGSDVTRHHAPLPDADVEILHGLQVTTLDRTVYDLIRTVSLEAAVIAFDGALHRLAWNDDDNTYDYAAAAAFVELVRRRVQAHPGARGIRQARFVLAFADGRAGSPGESLSRLWMWQLDVPIPELQFRVELSGGRYKLLDFAWPTLGRWGEFDGDVKYTDQKMLAGRSPREVLEAQRRRQAEVQVATGWNCDRWGFERMPSFEVFATFIASIGLLDGRA
jgi:hypothetical protein